MGLENNIPEGWSQTTLGAVCENISRRFNFQGKENVVFVNTGDVLNGKFLHHNKISKEGLPGQAKKAIEFGDVLYSEIRPKNKRFALVDFDSQDYVVSTKFMVLKRNDKIDLDFFYLFLKSNKTIKAFQSHAEARSGTFPQITFDTISLDEINLPPLQEQKAIAKVLTAFDDKIELLQEQNKTLETMAQTIFKERFGKYKIGDELPEGWRENSLDNIALEITRGFTTNYVEKSDIINLNQKVNKGKKLDKQYFKYYPNDTIVPSNKFIKKYDILLNSLGQGTLGRVHLYKENTKNVVADQHVSILRFSEDLSYYVYQILASKSGQYRLENEITGSTGMLMLNIGRVRDFKIIVPIKEKLELFKKSLDPIYGKVEINNSQIQSLTKTRETLLPKLMSGQVRVNNIKQTADD